MLDLNKLTPDEYRLRYEALQEAARARAASPPEIPPIADIPESAIVKRESIPPGCYVALRIKRGDAIRITNPAGTPGAALFLWNADNTCERLHAGDTAKVQWTTNLTTGRLLLSDMGRVLAAITADTGAGHDCILGPNTPAQTGNTRNGRDNLRLAATKLDMTKRDIGPAISLFSSARTDAEGVFHYNGPPPAGAMVELLAEMNLLIALSNTPHVLAPPDPTGPIDFVIHHAPRSELCRTYSDEAVRAYENTEAFFA